MIMKKKSQMVKVNLAIENKNWKSRYPTVNSFLTKSIKKILSSIFSSRAISFEISILLTGTKNMKNLNKKFRKINKDTDVLSFPAEEKSFFNKEKIKMRNIILLSFFSAYLISIRISGILIFIQYFVGILVLNNYAKINFKSFLIKNIKYILYSFVTFFLFVLVLNPIFWHNPFEFFNSIK